MKKSALALFLLISMAFANSSQSQEQPLKNTTDSLSYCFGVLIGNNMMVQGVDQMNEGLFMQGFNHGYTNAEPLISMEFANQFIQDYFNKQISNEGIMNLEKSNAFLAENQVKEGVVTLPSGLQYKVITAGAGDFPQATDQVRVHYHGTFIDGKVFDSSIDRNEPIVFGVDQVIPGWTEALKLMQPGAKWMLYIPSSLAYGEQGAGGVIGPNQALVFEVELLEIIK
jgi:FKBP-type peptidyl-prolyl cis-trans isomerase FklB